MEYNWQTIFVTDKHWLVNKPNMIRNKILLELSLSAGKNNRASVCFFFFIFAIDTVTVVHSLYAVPIDVEDHTAPNYVVLCVSDQFDWFLFSKSTWPSNEDIFLMVTISLSILVFHRFSVSLTYRSSWHVWKKKLVAVTMYIFFFLEPRKGNNCSHELQRMVSFWWMIMEIRYKNVDFSNSYVIHNG